MTSRGSAVVGERERDKGKGRRIDGEGRKVSLCVAAVDPWLGLPLDSDPHSSVAAIMWLVKGI